MTHEETNGSTTSRYPLDFEDITKGLRLEQADVERIVNVKLDGTEETAKRYRFGIMKLAQEIESMLRDLGTPVTVRTENGALVVLVDEDAAPHNQAAILKGMRDTMRAIRRLAEVDASKLSDETRAKHDRNLARAGAIQQAIIAARRKKLDFGPSKGALPAPSGD